MPDVTLEIAVIVLLLLANGFLALSEIAVVSARRSRLVHSAERGDAAAAAAAELCRSPTKFLSTVQVGITLIGILSGAYGGATIAEKLAVVLEGYPAIARYSEQIAVTLVVVVLAYLSVIIGELVPKRVALSNPERYAAWVARPMTRLSRIAAPAVAALEYTSDFIIKILHLPKGGEAAVTEADVASMIAAGTAAGVFEPAERRMVERVFRLDDEPVAAIMTPRRDIVWLDVNDSTAVHDEVIRQCSHTRFPVCDGDLDHMLGIINIRQLWLAQGSTPTDSRMDLRPLIQQPLFVPERMAALDLMKQFQATGVHLAIVVDEHGGVEGMVTLNNLLLFLVATPEGTTQHSDTVAIVQRAGNSWLVDGSVSLGDFYAAVGVDDPEAETPRSYHTVGGLLMATLDQIPMAGDRAVVGPLTLEVADMDGLRVDKVLVTRRPARSSDGRDGR